MKRTLRNSKSDKGLDLYVEIVKKEHFVYPIRLYSGSRDIEQAECIVFLTSGELKKLIKLYEEVNK